MSSAVNISFRYSERDFVRAMRSHYASRLRLWLDIPVIAVTAVGGVYLWQAPDSRWYGIALVGLSAILTVILVAAFGVIPRVVFRREPKFRDEYSLTFSPEGIHFRTTHIDSRLQWSLYSKALVDAHSFILYHGSRDVSVVPRRVFQTAEQQKIFEQLLTQNVPQIIRKHA